MIPSSLKDDASVYPVMQRHMADKSDAPYDAFQATCASAKPG